ncbi:MAG: polynucleotide adenylyltransferase PcnB [Cellvibrionaceae bacterium]|nr:polynucleotide adenylyltransferase PcnB [Cellvibrionaceae bacterium]
MLNRLLKLFAPGKQQHKMTSPKIIPVSEHGLRRAQFSSNALKVIEKLQEAGFSAFLVGGGVRDLLLEGEPKDFDVATNATPEETRKIFRNAMIIGRRFRIVHVRFGREIIEVTTFRAHHDQSDNPKDAEQSHTGMLLRDNVYGDIESDAVRRDFSVNALYYDPSNGNLLDYTNGLADLNRRVLQMIGDPEARYREDPVRMLRAVRFAAKLGFTMTENTREPIKRLAPLMSHVPPARLFEEVLKLMLSGYATATLGLLREHGLFEALFPGTELCLQKGGEITNKFVTQATLNTDKRIRQDKKVTPAFIYAAFLWPPLQAAIRKLMQENKMPLTAAMQHAEQGVISQQLSCTALPKRFLIPMKEIWALQLRLLRREGRKAFALLEHPRFRAAYDFLLLREQAGENLDGLGLWWTRFQDADEAQREEMVKELGNPQRQRRPRRRKPKAANSTTPPATS